MESKRVTFYDWLRLLATVCVVIGHSFYLNNETVYGGGNYLRLESAQDIYNTIYYNWGLKTVSWIYSFHMSLFFFLSGAVLSLKPIGTYEYFIAKKAGRLLIPYICVGYLFMLPMKYISGFYDDQGLKQAIRGLWRGIESGHLWFLPALFWDMIIFVAIYKVFGKIHLQKFVLPTALIVQYACQWMPKDILGLASGLSMFFWFVLGFEFEKKRERLAKFPVWIWIALLGAAIVTDCLIMRLVTVPVWTYILVRGSIICILAYTCDRYLKSVAQTKVYKLTVKYLFDIYLYHDPLEYLILFCFFRWNIVSLKFGGYLLIFFRIIGVITFSIGLGCIVEKVKNLKRKAV